MAKTTVQLNDEFDALLNELADDLQVPKTQVLRRSIALLKYIQDETSKNHNKLILQSQDGAEKEIVLK